MTDSQSAPHDRDAFLLDAVADDIESVEHILRVLHGPPDQAGARPHALEAEAIDGLTRLIQADLVQAYVVPDESTQLTRLKPRELPSEFVDAYFGITDKGRAAHRRWSASHRTPPSAL